MPGSFSSHLERFLLSETRFSGFFTVFGRCRITFQRGSRFQGKPEGTSDEDMRAYAFGNPGTLELTWNWGTEAPDSDFKGYANGNSDPGRGFGHICVAVDNLEEACARFEELGVRFIKKLTDGRMKTIAFIAGENSGKIAGGEFYVLDPKLTAHTHFVGCFRKILTVTGRFREFTTSTPY